MTEDTIYDLHLPPYLLKTLRDNKFNSVKTLLKKTEAEMLAIKGISAKYLARLQATLVDNGYRDGALLKSYIEQYQAFM